MPLSSRTSIHLRPNQKQVRHQELLKSWCSVRFEPHACKDELEQWVARYSYPQSWFDVSAVERGGLAATNEILFPSTQNDEWLWTISTDGRYVTAALPVEAVADIATLIRTLPHVDEPTEFLKECSEIFDGPIQSALSGVFNDKPEFGTWPSVEGPGIYRREHASLILSSGKTFLVTDPQGISGGWTTSFGDFPIDRFPSADAVLLTHGHEDHWHLPSTLRFCSEDTRVIVPAVPRVNLLTIEDFAHTLSIAGQPHRPLPWNSALRIGDFEIQALPFFGEQPTRREPIVPEGVRNWGNCYRVSCPSFSALILADAGGDPLGEMRDAIRDNVKEFGKVDAVLSCCLSFPEMINPGLSAYFLTIPFGRLREVFAEHQQGRKLSITSGVQGVAELCRIAGARYFLPYAHGFEGLLKPIELNALLGSENHLMTRLEGALNTFGASTSVIRWNPGDYFPTH